ncbi:HD domain-containing protein [Spirochaeta cellobiosiphila]|uniref:HD domain-containing protein n=1 Tax=Spirochaeta cellobiosiphila TaxID=504483 RepID=UPI0004130006|nr:HD domain-containing protein [Spirochaeta cellobiosiphila]
MNQLEQIFVFIKEIDKVKNIQRQSLVSESLRRENDAEHAWHLAMMAMVLQTFANDHIDLLKVLKMVLIHDIVEIDAGDVFLYDLEARKAQKAIEAEAARRIFGLLPHPMGQELIELWEDFEDRQTPESRFAASLDRIQPMLQNYMTGGKAWKEHKITRDMVLKTNAHIGEGSKELWEMIQAMIDDAVKKGYLLP